MKANLSAVSPSKRQQSVNLVDLKQTVHQKAINALIEIAVVTPECRAAMSESQFSVPVSQVPALFRAAIKEQKATRRNPYRDETAILETALALLEHAKGENHTREQEEFYSTLAFECTGKQTFRVKYEPENVTVN
jgi:hypothetical protein